MSKFIIFYKIDRFAVRIDSSDLSKSYITLTHACSLHRFAKCIRGDLEQINFNLERDLNFYKALSCVTVPLLEIIKQSGDI